MSAHGEDTDPVDKGLAEAFGELPTAGPAQSVLRALESRTGSKLGVHLESNGPEDEPVMVTEEAKQLRDPSGRYQVLGEIGRGAVGVVYKGRDVDLGRDVAMKILKDEYAERPDVLARFVEEAQIGGQLQHPGIVPVYELGLQAGERPYFAMKLVKGETLAAQLARRSDPAEDRRRLLGIFEHVCQTIAYAHARRVVHRDLKPANVMIGAFGEVQVVDWGFAKVLPKGGLDDEKESVAQATQRSVIETVRSTPGSGTQSVAGSMFGTPAYMPPEQAMGEVERMDQRSDVFGLGAILCEILTGAPPYLQEDGDVVQQAARGDTAGVVARLEACGAHEALIGLSKQCLSPARRARPESAGQVADAIAAYLSSVEERARQAEIGAAEARVRARSTVMLAAAAILVLALAGGGYLWVQWESARRQADAEGLVTASLQEASARQGKARASGLEDLSLWEQALAAVTQAQRLAGSEYVGDALKERAGKLQAEVRKERKQAAALVAQRKKDQAMRDALLLARSPAEGEVVEGDWKLTDPRRVEEAYSAAFHTYLDRKLEDLSLGQATDALRGSALAVELAAALDHWAMTRRRQRVTDELTRKLEHLARLLDPEDPWRNDLRDLIPDAKEKKEKLLQLASTVDVRKLPVLSLVLLGEALWTAGAKTEAVKVYRQGQLHNPDDFGLALRLVYLLRSLPEPDWQDVIDTARIAVALRPRLAGVWFELGLASFRADSPDEAVACYRRALKLDPKYVWAHNDLGVVLYDLGRYEEAIACFQGSIEIDPKYGKLHHNLGNALRKLGHLDDAVAEYRKAIEIEPKLAAAHNNLGNALHHLGRFDEAIACYRKAIEIDPKCGMAHFNLGLALKKLGRFDEAVACYRKAIEINPKYAKAHTSLGLALKSLGRFDEAVACYRKAIEISPKCAGAHFNLGNDLEARGDLGGAVAEFKAAEALFAKQDTEYGRQWQARAQSRIDTISEGIALLDEIISGQRTAGSSKQWAAATLHAIGTKRYAELVALTEKTLAGQRKLALDGEWGVYNPACAAALWSAAGKTETSERIRARELARAWLTLEVERWEKWISENKHAEAAHRSLRHALEDKDFASVRGEALEKLTEPERKAWKALWQRIQKGAGK